MSRVHCHKFVINIYVRINVKVSISKDVVGTVLSVEQCM